MFNALAAEYGCSIETQLGDPIEVLCELSREGWPGKLVLGLQNGDELNFGIDDFWSFFFPFQEVKSLFRKTAAGWLSGRSRLVYFYRGQRLLKIELQVKMEGGSWQRVYTDMRTMLLPHWTTRTETKYGI